MIIFDKLFDTMRKKGVSSYYLRTNNIVGTSAYYRMKNGKGDVDTRTLDKLCEALDCQPGDIMEYVPKEKEGRDGP